MAEIKKTITGDLFKYFCEHEVKGTEEEIFSAWVSQSTEMPEAEDLPICFQMIRNMKKSKVDKDILEKYGKLFY